MTPKVSYKIRKMQENARYVVVKRTWEHELEVELNETNVGVELDKKGVWMWLLVAEGYPMCSYISLLENNQTYKYRGLH